MRPVPVGAKGSFTLLVTPAHLASNFKDAMLPPVLSTPVMIMIMENAALNALKPYLEPGESAVGTRIDIRHVAATPVGTRVTGEARYQVAGPADRFHRPRRRRGGGDRRRHPRARAGQPRQNRRAA